MDEWVCTWSKIPKDFTVGKIYSTPKGGVLTDNSGFKRLPPDVYNKAALHYTFEELPVSLENE